MRPGHYRLDPSPARLLTEKIMRVVRVGITVGSTHTELEEQVYMQVDQYLNRPIWSGKVKPR